jgi:hypothetical protein
LITAVNFIGIESLRSQVGFGVDRLPAPARLIYLAASVLVVTSHADRLLQIEPGAPDWPPAIAPHVVSIAMSFPVVLLAHLLSRLSFTTDAIRAADRRIFGAFMVLLPSRGCERRLLPPPAEA